MKNIKKLLLFFGLLLQVSLVLPAQASGIGCWAWCAPKAVAQDEAHAHAVASRQACLAGIAKLQDTAADKKCIRLYKPADHNQAAAILVENGIESFYVSGYSDEHSVLVYEAEGIIKGVCVYKPSEGFIYALSVGNDYKRQGIGSALVYASMHAMKKNYNINRVSLISKASAKSFYEKLGFTFIDSSLACRYELQ